MMTDRVRWRNVLPAWPAVLEGDANVGTQACARPARFGRATRVSMAGSAPAFGGNPSAGQSQTSSSDVSIDKDSREKVRPK